MGDTRRSHIRTNLRHAATPGDTGHLLFDFGQGVFDLVNRQFVQISTISSRADGPFQGKTVWPWRSRARRLDRVSMISCLPRITTMRVAGVGRRAGVSYPIYPLRLDASPSVHFAKPGCRGVAPPFRALRRRCESPPG